MLNIKLFAVSIRYKLFSRVQNPTIKSYRRMTSMKFVKMLTLAIGLVTLATVPSYAFVPFAASSTVNMMNVDAMTGTIGGVVLVPISAGTVGAGETISLSLPNNVPISSFYDISITVTGTNATTSSAFKECWGTSLGSPYTMVGASLHVAGNSAGTFAYPTTLGPSTIGGITVVINQNMVSLTFGSPVTFATTDAINISGLRVDVSNMAVGGANLQVSLMAFTGQATLNLNQLYVATFVPEASTMTLTGVAGVNGTAGALKFYTNGTVYNGQNLVTLTLKEGFANAFETRVAGTAAYNYTRIKIPFTIPANLPLTVTGITLAGPDGATFANGQYWGMPTTSNPLEISIVSQDPTTLNSLQVGLTFGVTAGSFLPMTASPITFTAYFDSPPTNVPTAGTPYTPTPYTTLPYSNQIYYGATVRYKAPGTPWINGSIPISVVSQSSNLLSSFNSVKKNTDGSWSYDTGIAVTNLSGTNPSTLSTYPVSSPGTIVATLYPYDGSGPYTVDTGLFTSATSSDLKAGLDSTFSLPSKQTWKVMLSTLLTAATPTYDMTKEFTGVIRFKCNFSESSGVVFVYNINKVSDGLVNNYVNSFVGFQMASDTPTNFGGLNVNLTTGAVTGNVSDPKF
jgi:hypothetical protein